MSVGNRWWKRGLVIYLCGAVSVFVTVQIESALVAADLFKAWWDTPILYDLRAQILAALIWPIALLPSFIIAEAIGAYRRKPFKPLTYAVYAIVFFFIPFAEWILAIPVERLNELVPNDLLRATVIYIGMAVVSGAIAFGVLGIFRNMRHAA
ncbi:hypothetical protein PQU92_04420 [Asticcacaulis sp. BYS171W]|uniref:Uncharacterized protein n=1 Tax=Asticcacaulis aquaticus TaxID=2984212 RepID=A0ABT5HRD8_9CAUL|nr:hypothetical protein [Asticcacaulis aquaticus]MDC7682507.1 hypothetical protein [Asticcacaulis aquaticus]